MMGTGDEWIFNYCLNTPIIKVSVVSDWKNDEWSWKICNTENSNYYMDQRAIQSHHLTTKMMGGRGGIYNLRRTSCPLLFRNMSCWGCIVYTQMLVVEFALNGYLLWFVVSVICGWVCTKLLNTTVCCYVGGWVCTHVLTTSIRCTFKWLSLYPNVNYFSSLYI